MYLKNPEGDHKVEQDIARAVLQRILAAGYGVVVFDGEEYHPVTTDEATAWAAMGETDEDVLSVYDGSHRIGNILLLWGNGYDLVSDWSWREAYPGSEDIICGLAGENPEQ